MTKTRRKLIVLCGFQMENIEVFLKAVELYGVPSNSLFPTADLFEGRNMAMVISTILQFGSEVSQHAPSLSFCFCPFLFPFRFHPIVMDFV